MKKLALVGIVACALAGCPTAHTPVHSCDEARTAPDGTACDGFMVCTPTSCGEELTCSGGTLTHRTSLACDVGVGDRDASSIDAAPIDAAPIDVGPLDAGPCAPHPPASGTGCHVSSECDSTRFEMCYAPGTSTGCGICVTPMHLCASDADCAATDFCESYVHPCSHVGGCGAGSDLTSTRCSPRCTVDPTSGASSCAAGEACQSSGRCTPVSCVGGYVCPSHTTCHDSAGGDAHGCVRDTCALDGDCGCGAACIAGRCYDTLGTCMSPAA